MKARDSCQFQNPIQADISSIMLRFHYMPQLPRQKDRYHAFDPCSCVLLHLKEPSSCVCSKMKERPRQMSRLLTHHHILLRKRKLIPPTGQLHVPCLQICAMGPSPMLVHTHAMHMATDLVLFHKPHALDEL